MNHYEALEIAQTASQAEIKLSYRKLVKKYHPDLNNSEEASAKIRMINEAYEILSNPTSRNLYDLFLQGVPVKTELEDITPRQRYKEQYIRDRIRQQRKRMEQQIHYKQKFYTYFRMVNVIGFVASIVLSFDYYFVADTITMSVDKVTYSKRGIYVGFENGYRVWTSEDFYNDYRRSVTKQVAIQTSGVLEVPKSLVIDGNDTKYRIKGSYFAFNNVFSVILFLFSIVVVGNSKYTDFRLTCGLVSCIVLLWLFLLTAQYY